MNRREFLARGARLGAVLSGALVAGVDLGGCTSATPEPSARTTTTSMRTPSRSTWRTLAGALSGTLVRPASPSYDRDRLLYNARFSDPRPRAIAYCASGDDVARCVDFALAHGLQMRARSGGHSYGGYSSGDGLVIDVSALHGVRVDASGHTVRVGAGARLIDVYDALARRGRLLPSGSCPTIGVSGISLGGGVGVFGRRYGLTSDNLRSIDLVTAGADRVVADDSEHSDLLWACRGGGGGNFGIATALTFTVHPVPNLALFSVDYPWAAATDLLLAWQAWVDGAPDELWSNCLLFSQGRAGFLARVSGVFCGSSRETNAWLDRLEGSLGAVGSSRFVGDDSFLATTMIEAGCSGLSVAACHLAGPGSRGILSREAYRAKSSYLDRPTSAARASQLTHAVEQLGASAPSLGGGLAFDAYGGAINRVSPGETAFVHRNKLAGIQATYSWGSASSTTEIAAGERWLTWLGSDVFDPRAGAYVNYIDPTLENWAQAYYGSNLARLVDVKRAYDPDNRFHFAQSIPVRI